MMGRLPNLSLENKLTVQSYKKDLPCLESIVEMQTLEYEDHKIVSEMA